MKTDITFDLDAILTFAFFKNSSFFKVFQLTKQNYMLFLQLQYRLKLFRTGIKHFSFEIFYDSYKKLFLLNGGKKLIFLRTNNKFVGLSFHFFQTGLKNTFFIKDQEICLFECLEKTKTTFKDFCFCANIKKVLNLIFFRVGVGWGVSVGPY